MAASITTHTDAGLRAIASAGQQVDFAPIEQLVPYARNARTHTPAQVAQIKAAILEFGWTNPVLADARGIVAGHGRVLAARELYAAGHVIHLPNGAPIPQGTVPRLDCTGWSDAQRRAYIIADNAIALNAGWDEALLKIELEDLRGADFDLALVGFDDDDLAMFLKPEAAPVPIAIPPAPEKPRTVVGDVWVIGSHRIMCGDCREPIDVGKLMGDAKAAIAFTSPPYAEQRQYDEASGFRPIPPDDYVEWFAAVAENVQRHLAVDGSWFVNIKPHANGLDTHLYVIDLVIAHVRHWGWHFATELCWRRPGIPKQVIRRFKNQFEPVYQFTRGDWKMRPDAVRTPSDSVPKARGKGAGNTNWGQHQGGGLESIHFAGRQGEQGFEWFGDEYEDHGMAYPGNLLPTFAGTHEALGHSAAFPVGLPQFFVMAYTDELDAVYDPFCGSASTLVACEQTKRRGYGMELSPIYCDVSVLRMQQATGKPAIRESDGVSFAEAG